MAEMTDVATVTSKKMVMIPARIRKKYGLREGRKVRFVELDGGIFMVPLLSLKELDGAGRENAKALVEGARELDREHRAENALLLTTDSGLGNVVDVRVKHVIP